MLVDLLNVKKDNNYLECLKKANNPDTSYFSLACLQDFLNEREDEFATVIMKVLLERNETLAKKTIIEAVDRGTHRLAFTFDYSEFDADNRIEIEVGLAPISDLFEEMDGESFEKCRCFSKQFKAFLTDDDCYFVERRLDTAQILLSEMYYTNFDHFLTVFLENNLMTELSLRIQVAEDFLKENWYPFLNDDGSVKKDEYVAKIKEMTSENRWQMPLDVDWDIEKTQDFVGFLSKSRCHYSRSNKDDEVGMQTGVLFSELFDEFYGYVDPNDQIPSCTLAFYFFAEIFGLNIENNRRLSFEDGVNLVRDRVLFDDAGNEITVRGENLIDTTSFKPMAMHNTDTSEDFGQLCYRKIDADVVHDIIEDRSLDFDSLLDRSFVSEIAFEGQWVWEDEFDFVDNTRCEYALVVANF